ncbi:MAG TPA: pyridoxal phosphate-dependent aminotransferase [Candidatus Cloacimonadota bacterium]|nr:pyridoxal phosphate-dependent aminotransferase [Candidatus Cloacimonadota bacterium]
MTEANRFSGIELSLIRQVMASAPPDAINMALGELRFPLDPIFKQYAQSKLWETEAFYTPNAGQMELRELIAASYGPDISAHRICVTNGAEEAIFLSLFALSNPGDVVAIPDPDYTAYPAIAGLMQNEVRRLSFESDLKTVNWDRWEQILSNQVRFLILSLPQNPSGFYFNASELEKLASLCNRFGITVVIDEIYRELCFGDTPPQALDYFEKLVLIGGLSKSHCLSGWRIGWVLAPVEVASTLVKAKQYVSTCSGWMAQELAKLAFSEAGNLSNQKIKQQLANCRSYTQTELLSVISPERLFYPSAGPYMMIDVQTDDMAFSKELAKQGLITVPGTAFGQVCKGLIRINCALPSAELTSGCHILKGVLSQ